METVEVTGGEELDFGGVIPGAFNVDRAALLDSFRMLADLDPDVMCVGHGTSVVDGAGAAMRAAPG